MTRARNGRAASTSSTEARSTKRWRRGLLGGAVGLGILASCAAGFDTPSNVNTLRVLAVTADRPYARPGDEVTFRMTVFDGLVDPADPDAGPRDLQVLWLGGCFDPAADAYFLCFEQLAESFAGLAAGEPPPAGLVELDFVPGAASGEPDAATFTLTIPDDIITQREVTPGSPRYGVAFLFFAVCAGQLAPADLSAVEPWQPGEGIEFPLRCLDANGNPLGSDSFVPGYTQVYSFEDRRPNTNPPIDGVTFDGAEWTEELDDAPTVGVCPVGESSRKTGGCVRDQLEDCTSYNVNALVPDVAEADPGATGLEGQQLREIVWVSYYTDRGSFDKELALVSEAREGYQESHDALWYPPAEPGLATIWAVARDNRGGSSVVRRFVRVE